MRSLLLCCTLLLSLLRLTGQNLLPNPGFESFIECPGDTASITQIADWYPSTVIKDAGDRGWRAREYVHTCDPEVERFWTDAIGNGVMKRAYSHDPIEEEYLTTINWTTIQAPLESDTIYYLEFSAVPNLIYYLPEDKWYRTRCPQASMGYKFQDASFQDTFDLYSYIEPDLLLDKSGIRYEPGDILRIGNCYVAQGDEKFLMFGHFRHDYSLLDDWCIGEDLNPWLTRSTLMDDFKLQKLEIEICCDRTVCSKDLIDFSEYVDDYALSAVQYIWNDGEEGLVRNFEQSGSYRLEMATRCGSVYSNAIHIEVETCSTSAFVPNAFSPNEDGVNDLFQPLFAADFQVTSFTFSVFNRWGQLVFQSVDPTHAVWDGTLRGRTLPQGVYLWMLNYEFTVGDGAERVFESGEVTLIR